ncbi:MAG TPA: TolC family protein [Thermodesulfobacteriota bacterium]|nr:TolC family protein [Thermodesulfobacteriota bacterium]
MMILGGKIGNLTVYLVFLFLHAQICVADEVLFKLRDAVSTALENNNELKALESSVSAEKADIGISRSYLLPQINLEESFVRTNNPTGVFSIKLNEGRFKESDFEVSTLNNPDPVSDFETDISVEQPILAIQEALALKSANKEYMAKREEYGRQREYVAFRVVETYIQVGTAKEFVRVAQKALEDAREQLRIANSRFKSGLGLYSDTLRAETAVTEAEQQLVSTEKNLKVAKRSLGLLLGLEESVDAEAVTEGIALREFEYYTEKPLSRKDVASLQYRYESARTNVNIADAGYLPRIGVRGTYQLNDRDVPFGSEGDSWFVAAVLRWEIFNGGRREYERARASHTASQIEESLEGMKKSVSLSVYESYLAVEESEKNVELAEKSLETAAEGTRLVRKRYENSLSPFYDLLDSQLNLDRTRANLVAKRNVYSISVARLSFESGTILEDLGITN